MRVQAHRSSDALRHEPCESAAHTPMKPRQLRDVEIPEEVVDLLLQALETEMGGADVYRTALKCVHNERLRQEWSADLDQAEKHVRILRDACERLGLDPELDTPGRRAVRDSGRALMRSLLLALSETQVDGLDEIVCDCVALAGARDPSSWAALEHDEPLELESWSRVEWLPRAELLASVMPRAAHRPKHDQGAHEG
jgi:hypothetical protein